MSAKEYILAVDDEPNIRQLVSLVLQKHGFRVQTAASGSECLRLAESEPPSLILLDLQMPELTGKAVIRRLRRLPSTREVPIVVISGSANLPEFSDVDGFNAFIEKPFDLDDLVEVVKRFLDKNQAPAVGG